MKETNLIPSRPRTPCPFSLRNGLFQLIIGADIHNVTVEISIDVSKIYNQTMKQELYKANFNSPKRKKEGLRMMVI